MKLTLFPTLYDLAMAPAERGRLGLWRAQLTAGATGRVLEIGAGTGLNFRHYGRDAYVIAIDPDLAMLGRARGRMSGARARILLVAADAEALPFIDGAFANTVVGLAMCTIPQPQRALTEIHRTLAPGGSLRLLEHVRLEHPLLGRLQDWLTPVWRRVAGGCRLNRRTVLTISRSGFTLESVEPHLGGYIQQIVSRRARVN